MSANLAPTEHDECVVFVQWLELQGLMFSHVPNETFTKSWKQKTKNKQEGVRKGVPDYIIITPTGLAFVEMKRTKGGVISPEQKEWIEELNKLKGVEARVCKGAESAIEFISELL